jgi:hypothetical protein
MWVGRGSVRAEDDAPISARTEPCTYPEPRPAVILDGTAACQSVRWMSQSTARGHSSF